MKNIPWKNLLGYRNIQEKLENICFRKMKNILPGLDFELICDVVEPVEAMLFRT